MSEPYDFRFLIADFRLMKKYMSDTFRIRFLDFRFGNLKSKIENRKWGWGFAIILTLTFVRVGGRGPTTGKGS